MHAKITQCKAVEGDERQRNAVKTQGKAVKGERQRKTALQSHSTLSRHFIPADRPLRLLLLEHVRPSIQPSRYDGLEIRGDGSCQRQGSPPRTRTVL